LSILRFLQRAQAPTKRILAMVELPPWIIEESELLIPAMSTHSFLKAALRHADIPNLGLTVGEEAIDKLGLFGRLVRGAPTLGGALECAARNCSTLTSSGPVWLRLRGDRAEFCKAATAHFDPSDVGRQQASHLTLGVMIAIVRLAAGPSWRPTEVHLQSDEAPALRDAESLASAHIVFRQPATMITIPRTLLDAPLPRLSATEMAMDVDEWESSAPARDFAGSIPCPPENTFRASGRRPSLSV
jgi:Arabinose-binding domain of AraC transcription regulator, N-term